MLLIVVDFIGFGLGFMDGFGSAIGLIAMLTIAAWLIGLIAFFKLG